jgi:hypothetical protein
MKFKVGDRVKVKQNHSLIHPYNDTTFDYKNKVGTIIGVNMNFENFPIITASFPYRVRWGNRKNVFKESELYKVNPIGITHHIKKHEI